MSKPLLIVESPTKAKTITKFLGKDYTVLSSFGHIRDLPKSKIGVDMEHDFKPTYTIPTNSKKHVTELKKAAKDADAILLATDSDREGEAIAWHISEILKIPADKMKRITFHEITKSAIEHALTEARDIDMNLVNAQQARRILDRLVGYELSPLLWKTIRRGLSAGRVQSVALRLIVERERERLAFVTDEYWTIDAKFTKDNQEFEAKLTAIDGNKLDKLDIKDEKSATKIHSDLEGATFSVGEVTKKTVTKSPPAPFTTSTLQMEANNKLGMSAKQTMRLAQSLYETGRITYMRTDSVNLAETFLGAAQDYIKEAFGAEYATGAKTYKTKKKGAQEAHEAIRPTEVENAPDGLRQVLDAGEWKLYDLIWRRAVASQLPAAKLERTGVDIEAKNYRFRASGSTIDFDGFMKVYRSATEKLLPDMKTGDKVDPVEIVPNQHFTEPPARFSDATLVKHLEEHGIGRPSTYAPMIGTLLDREYVERDDNKKLGPTDIGMIVNDMLVKHFPGIVDFEFTAKMENDLDNVAEGGQDWVPMLDAFYKPFHEKIEEKDKTLTREDVMPDRELGKDPETGLDIVVRTGRFGPYIQLGEAKEPEKGKKKKDAEKPKTVSLAKNMTFNDVTLEQALGLLSLPRTVGTTAEGDEIKAAIGRFGPYLKAGKATASLGEDHDPITIDEKTARQVLIDAMELKKQLAKPIAELGEDPESGGQILVKNGRFGPYVTDGTTNASINKKIDPETVDREQAIEMLVKKRARVAAKAGKGKKK